MKNRKRLLLLVSIIFAILSSISIYFYLDSLTKENEVKVEMYKILVASENIVARTIITEEQIIEIEIPFESNSTQFFNKKEEIIGMYTKNDIDKDSQFNKSSLIVNQAEEISLKISGNMRAVSVGISGNSGIANLIKPGDRVDVVVYLPELRENQILIRPDIVKILLQNIEVLAVDQNLAAEKKEITDEEIIDSKKLYIASLAVSIYDVETLILAKGIGMIDLVLRPIEGDYIYQTEGVIWQELLLDDFNNIKDMFPNYEVNIVGELYIDPNEIVYEKYVYYTVKHGDTLREISLLFYNTEELYLLLKQVNNIIDENIITAGMGIKVPILEDRGVEDEKD